MMHVLRAASRNIEWVLGLVVVSLGIRTAGFAAA